MRKDTYRRGNALTHALRRTFADWLLQEYEGEEKVQKAGKGKHKETARCLLKKRSPHCVILAGPDVGDPLFDERDGFCIENV